MIPRLTLSSLLSRTVEELQENARLFGLYMAITVPFAFAATLFQGPSSNLFNFGGGVQITEALMAQGTIAVIVVIIAFIVGIVLHYYLIAGLVRQTISPGFDRLLAYIGISILSTIAIGFGFVLLFVPGVILAVRWAPIIPAAIDRPSGAMDAFGDSWEMTKGVGWSIFGAFIVLVIALIVVAAIITGTAAFSGPVVAGAVGAVTDSLTNAVFAAFTVAAYRLLKDDAQELAEVFE